ncbi:hypothetical protein BH09VER1_BH09VER1_50580 [soil metagenome]
MKRILLLSLWGSCLLRAATPPEVHSDHPDCVEWDESVTYTASGGSTDAPPDDFGKPPWHRTGNRQYIWNITPKEPGSDGVMPKVEDDGKITKGTLVFDPQIPGSWSISVTLQEEWEDSNEAEPLTVYWPKG